MNYFILLSFSYAIPIALLIWLWFGGHLGRKGKLAASILLPMLYFVHWSGLQQTQGWPAEQGLPTRFELISADVQEPDPIRKLVGNIHLWVRPEGSENKKPRAYSLPYSRELHKLLFETKQRVAQGQTQMGLLYSEESGGSGAAIGNGMKLDFKDAPRRQLPPKI